MVAMVSVLASIRLSSYRSARRLPATTYIIRAAQSEGIPLRCDALRRVLLPASTLAAEAHADRFQHPDARRADEPVSRRGRQNRKPAPWHAAIEPDCLHPPHRHVVWQRRAAPLLDDHQTCVHGDIRGVIRGEQVTVPVTHPRLPLARVARSSSRTIKGAGEELRRVNLMQCHEGRFRRVDRLEALAGAESRDGQQPTLVSDVPGVPLGAPRGLEQRHLYHVDHAVSPNVRRYITFPVFDFIRTNRLILSRISIW